MTGTRRTRPRSALWATAFTSSLVGLALLGEAVRAEQIYTFGVSQKLQATDNLRLDPETVGTTTYADTKLRFGLQNTTALSTLNLDMSGVARYVNDPTEGTVSALRDPEVILGYQVEGLKSRLQLEASYAHPDLAFIDPLETDDISEQDLYSGGGRREEISGRFRFETNISADFGVVVEQDYDERRYTGASDPLLFDNTTSNTKLAMLYSLSGATKVSAEFSEDHYDASDTNGTDRETRRATLGIDHEFSHTDRLRFVFGTSEVTETFSALPGTVERYDGLVGELEYQRDLHDGVLTASLDSTLTSVGRQTTLELGRRLDLPLGFLDLGIGAVQADEGDPELIGRVAWEQTFSRSTFDVDLSHRASASETLSQFTTTSEVRLGYALAVNDISTLALDANYAEIDAPTISNSRSRGRIRASYSRDVTKDWDMIVGMDHRRFQSGTTSVATSNGVFFTLQREFQARR